MSTLRTTSFICRQLLLYSLITAHESHLGTLPGVFSDQQLEQSSHDGCDHDHGLVPTFSSPENGSVILAHHGASAQLLCAVHHLSQRAVSWIRKTEDDLQILTVGEARHTSDPRVESEFIYPHGWLLKINPALVNDSGSYLCHVSTDPPLIRHVHLVISVPEPIVELLDGQGAVLLPDTVLYYRIGSSLDLHCRVRRYWIKPKRFSWLKSGRPLTDDIWRGGISIYTEATKPGELGSKLGLSNATSGDGGNYTCVLDTFSANVIVHFLKEEKQAASQHASNTVGSNSSPLLLMARGQPWRVPIIPTVSCLIAHHLLFLTLL